MILFLVPMLQPLHTLNRNVRSMLVRFGILTISYTEMCFDIDLIRGLMDTVFDQHVITRTAECQLQNRQWRVQHRQDVKSTVFFIFLVNVIHVKFPKYCSCLNFCVYFPLMHITTGFCMGKTTVAEIETLQLDFNMSRLYAAFYLKR